ncbi:MAG TPA: alcohol dehydrogenase catalytic domain-containing protein [Candidatus Acidoferrales bacterium]|nr:alcohol dehydrogenase catalytic domain-containing protein [Candidatus Acidoferrales bacterium]
MKAAVKDRPEPGIWVKDAPMPNVGPDEVLVRVHKASICGSDIGLYDYSAAFSGFAKLPTIPGHEFAGEVAQVSSGVSDFKVGERVVAESILSCGNCKFCLNGQPNICINFKIFGVHTNGGFAEYVSVPRKNLHHIREGLSFAQAAIIEPLSVGCHAIEDVATTSANDSIVVLGPGPIGLLAAQVARANGCKGIVISGIDVDEKRMAIASKLGFETVNSSKEDLVRKVLDSTSGLGVDMAMVAAGSGVALNQACQIVRKGGKILNVAIYPKPVEVAVTNLVRREMRLLGTFASTWKNYERAMTLASENKVSLEPLITHSFPLEETKTAIETAKAREGCKVQLTM